MTTTECLCYCTSRRTWMEAERSMRYEVGHAVLLGGWRDSAQRQAEESSVE